MYSTRTVSFARNSISMQLKNYFALERRKEAKLKREILILNIKKVIYSSKFLIFQTKSEKDMEHTIYNYA